MKIENELSKIVFETGLKVHRQLGPGLLESSYEVCLCHELKKNAVPFERQVILPLVYDGVHLDAGYKIDLLFAEQLIVEIKSVKEIADIHLAQKITYLKLSNCKLALLINFNSVLFKAFNKRVFVN